MSCKQAWCDTHRLWHAPCADFTFCVLQAKLLEMEARLRMKEAGQDEAAAGASRGPTETALPSHRYSHVCGVLTTTSP